MGIFPCGWRVLSGGHFPQDFFRGGRGYFLQRLFSRVLNAGDRGGGVGGGQTPKIRCSRGPK